MNPTKRRGLRVSIAAIAAVLTLFVGSGASGSNLFRSEGAPPVRSSQAGKAEADIVRTNLAARMEAALGDAFSGVWFEPSTAQLHVGVTSPADRQTAEAVAARAGLPEAVTETHVASTWAQLQAAQDRWDERLWDLLERGEAATALDPVRNSVEVELGSLVSPSRREALERLAEADRVNVSIESTPYPHLRVVPQSKCKKHAVGEAFCEPTLVSGVTFDGQIKPLEFKSCTAGPAVVKKNSEPTQIYVLTAGHCIEEAKGGQWFAYNTEGFSAGKHEVGLSATYLNGATDVGVVRVDAGYWAEAESLFPVTPSIAPWDQKEPEPFSVKSEVKPTLGTNSCISAQKVGIGCGEIKSLEQTIKVGTVITENLVEVENVGDQKGDSGASWFSEKPFKEELKGFVEGTHVGGKSESKNSVFQPLWKSLEQLKALRGMDLELLTTANQRREHKLTSPKNTRIPASSVVEAVSAGATTLDGTINITCQHSTVKVKITDEGGATGPVESLTFGECGNNTVTVVEGGALEIHSSGSGNGTLTSTGAVVTALTHSLFLGTRHCIFVTEDTDVGTLKGSDTTGGTAIHAIDSAPIPQASTDFLCGEDTEWTGSYTVTSPDSLYVD